MALPIAPVALLWLRYAACLAVLLAALRYRRQDQRDGLGEQALDEVCDGLELSRDNDRLRASGKWRWHVPTGSGRRALELEASFLGRLRLRRV